MRKLLNIGVLSLMLCITSCSDTKIEHDLINLNIDVNNLSSTKDIFSDFHFVPLETVGDKLIGEIDKILADSNYFYILDSQTKSIFIYNHKGKYINQISRLGRAGEEYLSVDDIAVYNSHIYALCRSSRKINVYSNENKYIKSIPLNDWYTHFHILNDSLMFLDSEDSNAKSYNFILHDYQNGEDVALFDGFEEQQSYLFSGFNPFNFNSDSSLFITKHFDMNVYTLGETAMTPKYNLNFNTTDLLPSDTKKNKKEELSTSLRYKNVVKRISEFKMFGKYIYMYYDLFVPSNGGLRSHITVVDTTDYSSKTLLVEAISGDKIPMMGSALSINNGYFITHCSASRVKSFDERNKLNIFSSLNLSDYDNPLLFFYKFK